MRWVRITSGSTARRGSARKTPRPACSSAPAAQRLMRIYPVVAPTRPSLAPHSPLTRPSRLLRAGSSTASGSTRATMAASRSASESSCNECIHRTRPPARREALLNRASLSQHAHEYWACMHPSCSMSLVAQSRGLCLCWRKLSAYVDLACAVLYIYAYIPITVPLF